MPPEPVEQARAAWRWFAVALVTAVTVCVVAAVLVMLARSKESALARALAASESAMDRAVEASESALQESSEENERLERSIELAEASAAAAERKFLELRPALKGLRTEADQAQQARIDLESIHADLRRSDATPSVLPIGGLVDLLPAVRAAAVFVARGLPDSAEIAKPDLQRLVTAGVANAGWKATDLVAGDPSAIHLVFRFDVISGGAGSPDFLTGELELRAATKIPGQSLQFRPYPIYASVSAAQTVGQGSDAMKNAADKLVATLLDSMETKITESREAEQTPQAPPSPDEDPSETE